jgi:hypothetical protein
MDELKINLDCHLIYKLGSFVRRYGFCPELKTCLSIIEGQAIRLSCEDDVFPLRRYGNNMLPMGKDADYTELEVVIEDFEGSLHALPFYGDLCRYAIFAKDYDEGVILAYYETEEDANKQLTIFKQQIEENKHE